MDLYRSLQEQQVMAVVDGRFLPITALSFTHDVDAGKVPKPRAKPSKTVLKAEQWTVTLTTTRQPQLDYSLKGTRSVYLYTDDYKLVLKHVTDKECDRGHNTWDVTFTALERETTTR